MVLRPESGQGSAVETALGKLDVPYDFDYKTDEKKLYCFELVAVCYPQAGMRTHEVKKLLGLVKRDCYIAKSIYGCPFFKAVFEKNDKG